MRKGTKARIERQKRALARFSMVHQVAWEAALLPNTYIRRFKDEDAYAVYYARKIQEKSALQVRIQKAV